MKSNRGVQGAAPLPRLPLDRRRILAAAVELADERGVAAITMRELASKLGVEAMSLYNHVASKDEILDGMMDLVMEEIVLPTKVSDWRAAMRTRSISARRIFERHPWAPQLLDSRTSSGPRRLAYFDQVLGILAQAGFSDADAVRAFSLLDSYVYGFGIQQSHLSLGDSYEGNAEAILRAVPAEEYPTLHRIASLATLSGYDAESDFSFGLELILDGLGRLLASGNAAPRREEREG